MDDALILSTRRALVGRRGADTDRVDFRRLYSRNAHGRSRIYGTDTVRRVPRPWRGTDWVDQIHPARSMERIVRSIELMGYIL